MTPAISEALSLHERALKPTETACVSLPLAGAARFVWVRHVERPAWGRPYRCESVTPCSILQVTWQCSQCESGPAVLLHSPVQKATIQTQTIEITAMSYSPRILRGRRHFEGPFQTVPLSHLSFQEICHKSDECPLIRAMGHCKNGWHAQCARRGVCCTVRNEQKQSHYKPFDQSGTHHLELDKEQWSWNPGIMLWVG